MSSKIECERKFLISNLRHPATWPVEITKTKISQTYLRQTRPGVIERIRVSETDGKVEIVICMKEFLSSGVNKETEMSIVDITTAEWMELQERADPTRGTIIKTRYTFIWNGLTYEVDIFEEPNLVNTLLEVELENMSQNVEIPPFLTFDVGAIHEVTGQFQWTNHQIALLARDTNL